MAPPSTDDIDWDQYLLDYDWANNNWRNVIGDLQLVPWERVTSSTVYRIAQLHREYDDRNGTKDGQLNPVTIERLRRLNIDEITPRSQRSDRSMVDWISPRDKPRKSWTPSTPRKNAPPPVDLPPKDTGHFTIGFELELPIAVYRRGGLMADRPHPHDLRFEAERIVDDNQDPARIRREIEDEVLRVLNNDTDMVFIRRHEDEGTLLYDFRERNLQELEAGRDSLEPEAGDEEDSPPPSPSGPSVNVTQLPPNLKTSARNIADMAIQQFYDPGVTPAPGQNFDLSKSLRTATDRELRDALTTVPLSGVGTQHEVDQTRKLAWYHLQVAAFQAQRDPLHVHLPGMKERYRAFSVYAMPDTDFNNMRWEDYTDAPPVEEAENPADLYGWEMIKIASPVMDARRTQEVQQALLVIIRVVRQHFRIHKDVAAIPATTQINLSHTEGFTLLEAKKMLTLFALLEGNLARLNRRFRCESAYSHVCGDVKTISNLGALSAADPAAENFDPLDILPRPPYADRVRLLDEMDEYFPAEYLLRGDPDVAEKVFYTSVWLYEDISALCAAATAALRVRRTALVAKLRGEQHTHREERGKEEEFIAEKFGYWFDVVDAERGVFEFRGCSGTLDHHHVLAWATIGGCIVELARADAATYRNALTRIMRGDESILDILQVDKGSQDWYRARMGDDGYFHPSDDGPVSWNDPFWPPMP
ncbi:hypothetical protein F4819DRAFT_457963 [Hypoxylon fuscum]|nr:hypothetical protein F4819DRAFT_457963 [Hypoxylon fuscum]